MAATGKSKTGKDASTFSADEKAAMREYAAEKKKAKSGKADGEADLRAKIAEMPEHDRVIAETIHRIVTTTAPELTPKTWYGQPAYAKGDQIVCFFQSAAKFGVRYATLGFNEAATLDDGSMWPVAFAIKDLTPADETLIAQLVTKAVG